VGGGHEARTTVRWARPCGGSARAGGSRAGGLPGLWQRRDSARAPKGGALQRVQHAAPAGAAGQRRAATGWRVQQSRAERPAAEPRLPRLGSPLSTIQFPHHWAPRRPPGHQASAGPQFSTNSVTVRLSPATLLSRCCCRPLCRLDALLSAYPYCFCTSHPPPPAHHA